MGPLFVKFNETLFVYCLIKKEGEKTCEKLF